MMTCEQKAIQILSRRDHSSTMLREKLSLKGYLPEEIEKTIQKMLEYRYLNDEKYKKDRVLNLAKKGKGELWIKQKCKIEGIDVSKSEIASFIDDYGLDSKELLLTEARKKLRRLKSKDLSDSQKILKIKSYLYGKGFHPEDRDLKTLLTEE